MADLIRCIPSNPDITGIGVRTAIYAQNLLSFVPAIVAILDKEVTPTELETLEQQSTTILITAFAILLSAIVQTCTSHLTNYHAAIVLNLSWINNTNTFIYFVLYFHHRARLLWAKREQRTERDEEKGQERGEEEGQDKRGKEEEQNDRGEKDTSRKSLVKEAKKASRNPVLVIGSLHLSLMAAFGTWLWSRPTTFGSSLSPPCPTPPSIVVFTRPVSLSSAGLRSWSLLIYSVLLTPALNLVIPTICFSAPFFIYHRKNGSLPSAYGTHIRPILWGLAALAIINVALIADTEVTIKKNAPLLVVGDAEWTFGQTLALLLLLVPLRDLSETFLARRPKQLGRRLLDAAKEGNLGKVEYFVKQGANSEAKGEKLNNP